MRHFFYSIQSERISRTYGGADVVANVYRRSRGGDLVQVGTVKWCTRAYKGEESEVLDLLVREKLVPKSWAPDGYYRWSNTKYKIRKV